MGEGHVVGCLVTGVTDHQTLISGSDLLVFFVLMDTLGDFGWLFVNGNDYCCGFVIHSDFVGIISNFLNGLSGDLFEVDVSTCADLPENHADWVFDGTLACDFSVGVFFEAGVKDGVGDVVTEFVGVSGGDVFRGEQEVSWLGSKLLAFHKFINRLKISTIYNFYCEANV